jgi:hypothetical protein
MFKSYTNTITPPPAFLDEDEDTDTLLVDKLYLYSVRFPTEVVKAYSNLITYSSFYDLFDLVLFSCPDSLFGIPVCSLQFFITKSLNSTFIQSFKYSSSYIEQTIKSLTSQSLLQQYLETFLLLKPFSIDSFLKDPMYLIDWCLLVDPSYTSILQPIKDRDINKFFIELVNKSSNCYITIHIKPLSDLLENIQRYYFNYVLGAIPIHGTV